MKRPPKTGQSIVEYTLLLGVVVGIIAVVMLSSGGKVRKGVADAYNKAGDALGNATTNLTSALF